MKERTRLGVLAALVGALSVFSLMPRPVSANTYTACEVFQPPYECCECEPCNTTNDGVASCVFDHCSSIPCKVIE